MNKEKKINSAYKEIIYDSEHAIEESLYQKNFSCCAPAKLFKREVIGNIQFPVGKLAEDLATCHLFFDNANTIVYSNIVGYYYRQQSTSIMHKFNPRRLDALKWARQIEKFCKEKYPHIVMAAYCRTFNVSVHLLLDIDDDKKYDKYLNTLWRDIKRTRIATLVNRKARNRERIAALLSFFGRRVLRFAWNSRFSIKRKEH